VLLEVKGEVSQLHCLSSSRCTWSCLLRPPSGGTHPLQKKEHEEACYALHGRDVGLRQRS